MQMRNNCVVFDLETTGMNSGEDSIIELAAIKLKGGKITDRFHSFVFCQDMLSKRVERLTGIKNKVLAEAPSIEKTIEDFYSFADGCILAAYNMSFGYAFVERYGKMYGFSFNNNRIDILSLVKEQLQSRVSNFKLSTVAAYYGIDLRRRTVLDEAVAASEILLNLK